MKKLLSILIPSAVMALMVLTVDAKDPYTMEDQAWIRISGTVTDVTLDTFTLDYGEGSIIVEMDDWDWYSETAALTSGDEVTVYGEIDDDLFELTTIEASSVYVDDLKTFFYANDADEEDIAYMSITTPVMVTSYDVVGTVAEVNGREFTINTGGNTMTVDTLGMLYNPLDDEGFQQINKGDVVRVTGDLDFDLFENLELEADTIITLSKDKTKKSS